MFDENALGRGPDQSELYFWADYVEILCLSDVDGHYSAERLSDWLHFAEDLGSISPDALDPDPEDVAAALQLGAGGQSSDSGPASMEELDDLASLVSAMEGPWRTSRHGRAAEQTDDRRRWSADVFMHLAARQQRLGASYPFSVNSRSLSITRRDFAEEFSAYTFYLCCSALRYFPASVRARFSREFEQVSFLALQAMLPSTFRLEVFGTTRDPTSSMFRGTAFQRISMLASVLRARLLVSQEDFHPRDFGDNGLDLVAWLPMPDESKGVPSFFAQCACGQEWEFKQYEASPERWSEFMALASPPVKVTFIPHYFRKPEGSWYEDSKVSGVLIDRLRALGLAGAGLDVAVPRDLVSGVWTFRRSD